ncbi:MAG TPA: FG-GAP repeat protein [Povalibacter sp.]
MDSLHCVRSLASLLFLSVCIACTASAHEPTQLYPQAYLPFDACSGFKCFHFDGELEGDRAVASNTSHRVGIFRAAGSSWTTEQALRSPDTVPGGLNESIQFGSIDFVSKTALSGNALLIGGTSNKYPGKQVVYVYQRQNGVWLHTQVLALPVFSGYLLPTLGEIVIDGNIALIGSLRFTDNSPSADMLSLVHVFVRNADGRFQRRADLRPPTATEAGAFRLAISGNTAVVGDPVAGEGRGAVYVYEHGSAGWPLRAILKPSTATGDERFGTSVDVEDTRIVVGAPGVANGVRPGTPGAAYVYERTGGVWNAWTWNQTLRNPFVNESPESPLIAPFWEFGSHVSLSGNRVLVGSEDLNELPPLGYLFERRSNGWRAVGQLANVVLWFPGHVVVSGNRALASASDSCCGLANYTYALPPLGTLPAVTP